MGSKNLKWCDKCGEESESMLNIVSVQYSEGEPFRYELCSACMKLFQESLTSFSTYLRKPKGLEQ